LTTTIAYQDYTSLGLYLFRAHKDELLQKIGVIVRRSSSRMIQELKNLASLAYIPEYGIKRQVVGMF